MFDNFSRIHERNRGRAAGGVLISVLFHAALVGAVVYGSEAVRSAVSPGGGAGDAGTESLGPLLIPGQNPPTTPVDSSGGVAGSELLLAGLTLPPEVLEAAELPHMLAHLPDTFELGRPQRVRLAVPPNRLPADSIVRVRDAGGSEISPVRISHARQATLYGEKLIVEPQSPPLQLTDSVRRTEWYWIVTPTEPGARTVHLQLDAPAEVGGFPRIVTLQRLRQEVYVRATPVQKLSRFFSRNWTLLTLITIVAVTGWIRSRMGKRGAAS
jgi:hypothetical protein